MCGLWVLGNMGDVFGWERGFEKRVRELKWWGEIGKRDGEIGVGVMGEVEVFRLGVWERDVYGGLVEVWEEWGMGELGEVEMLESGLGWVVGKRERYGRDVWWVLGYVGKEIREMVGWVE